MVINCLELAGMADMAEPATQDAIRIAQKTTGHTFPSDYIELLTCSNGLELVSTNGIGLRLFSIPSDLVDMNIAYEVRIYLPDWLMIGADGSGHGIYLDCTDSQGALYRLDTGSPFYSDATSLARCLSEWVADGFDLGEPQTSFEDNYPDRIDVWLVRPPAGGPKELLRLKKELHLETSIGELYRGLQRLPYRLLSEVPFRSYATECAARYNQTDDCLRFSEVGQPESPVEFPSNVINLPPAP